jgi:quinol monooxygenase YgiN
MQATQIDGKLAFTVAWEVQPGKERDAEDIIARFAPLAREEPGLELLMVSRSTTNPRHFLFYEIFRDQAAFDAHQQTAHFRTLIMEQALPLLSHRERLQYTPL